MKYYIYLIENNIDGKTYIGQRKTPINKTPNTDYYFGSGIFLKRALKKYGRKNFSKKILFELECSEQEINELEIKTIAEYKAQGKAEYNIAAGGNQNRFYYLNEEEKSNIYKKIAEKTKGHIVSQETKDKISQANKGRKWSLEAREKISEQRKGKPGNALGHKLSQESKDKISKTKKGCVAWNIKKVLCIETQEIFNSIKEAAENYNLSSSAGISMCCSGKQKTAGGYHWKILN